VESTVKLSLGRCSLRINPELSYKINLDNAAADSKLDFSNIMLEEMQLNNNAGNVEVRLNGNVDRVNVGIDNNAGNVRLRVPKSHAVRITARGSLSSDNLERCGLVLKEGVAQSSDWDENSNGVDIALSQNVASFVLDWKRSPAVGEAAQDTEDEQKPNESFKDDPNDYDF
jgi:hypothetical protein